MALLQVFQNGRKIKELTLRSGKEWTVGRASSCDLVLDGERGISRQHLKLHLQNGQWIVEVLSRYGELYQENRKVNSIALENETRFEVPPFEFVFLSSSVDDSLDERTPIHGSSSSVDFGERTQVGALTLAAYLKVCDESGFDVQAFRLEGHAWVAGRDVNCTLFIDNPKFSRRHFEIRFEEGAYLIKDLGSSNGTLLNEEPLSTTAWAQLKSGDVITVVDWTLHFELRDASFEDKMKGISPELQQSHFYPSVDVQPSAIGMPAEGFPVHEQAPPQTVSAAAKKKTLIIRALIGVLVVIGLIGYLLQDGSGDKKPAASNAKASPFEKLPPQQQQYIKDTYRLADRLFKEGRYEMARQEVAKIHQLVPAYEESKNLEKLADVAIQTQVEQQKAEAREKEKAEMEEKIQRTVAECRKLVNSKVEMKAIDDCLMPVITLNPDHASIVGLKSQVDQLISDRTARQEKQAEYAALVRKQKGLYEKATGLVQNGKPLDAIQAFETVVSSKLPDPHNLKGEAKRQIASLQKELTVKQSELEKESEDAQKKGDLKTAIVTLQKALAINPENETIKGRINSLLGELKKQVQTLYQEGVLEESVGEVETAKTKWKKIVESSLPEEEYFKKAKSKLKKYGID